MEIWAELVGKFEYKRLLTFVQEERDVAEMSQLQELSDEHHALR